MRLRCPICLDFINEAYRSRIVAVLLVSVFMAMVIPFVFEIDITTSCEDVRLIDDPTCEDDEVKNLNQNGARSAVMLLMLFIALLIGSIGNAKYQSGLWNIGALACTGTYIALASADIQFCVNYNVAPSPLLSEFEAYMESVFPNLQISDYGLNTPSCVNINRHAFTPEYTITGGTYQFNLCQSVALLHCESLSKDTFLVRSILQMIMFILMIVVGFVQFLGLFSNAIDFSVHQNIVNPSSRAYDWYSEKLSQFQSHLHNVNRTIFLHPDTNQFHVQLLEKGFAPSIPIRLWTAYLLSTILDSLCITVVTYKYAINEELFGGSRLIIAGAISFVIAQLIKIGNIYIFVCTVLTTAEELSVQPFEPVDGFMVASDKPKLLVFAESQDAVTTSELTTESPNIGDVGSPRSSSIFSFFRVENDEHSGADEKTLYLTLHSISGNDADFER